ncbi:hypothetical protein GN956_G2270 [Arapaima gigas]
MWPSCFEKHLMNKMGHQKGHLHPVLWIPVWPVVGCAELKNLRTPPPPRSVQPEPRPSQCAEEVTDEHEEPL